jgi:hypothetical protein
MNGNESIPLSQDLGRAFLYVRYTADLSHQGPNNMEMGDIDPARVGKQVAQDVRLKHFGSFVGSRA